MSMKIEHSKHFGRMVGENADELFIGCVDDGNENENLRNEIDEGKEKQRREKKQ